MTGLEEYSLPTKEAHRRNVSAWVYRRSRDLGLKTSDMKVCALLGPDPDKDWHHLGRLGFQKKHVLAVDVLPERASVARGFGFLGFTGTMSEALFCQTRWFSEGFDFVYYDGCRQTIDMFGLFGSPLKVGALLYLNMYRREDKKEWRDYGRFLGGVAKSSGLAKQLADACGVSIKNRGLWAYLFYFHACLLRARESNPRLDEHDFARQFFINHPISQPGFVGRVTISEYRSKGSNYMDQIRIFGCNGHSPETLCNYGPDDIRNDTGHEFSENIEGRIAASLAQAKKQGLR